ncbi:MAG: photosynthetic complex assembly protein PuhC, partial [Gammaproteobacteria bacterium]
SIPTGRGSRLRLPFVVGLVVLGVLGVTGMRPTMYQHGKSTAPANTAAVATTTAQSAVAVRHLKFVDNSDGGISIFDVGAAQPFDTIAPGGNGFLRGTLRGLARARKLQHEGSEKGFDLIRTADGSLHLADPVTGRDIYLDAFGPTNASIFEQIMIKRSARP